MKAAPAKTPSPPAEPSARDRIVAGARRHFFAQGFRGVTMDELAAELGMSKKTLYAHFASKTALVEAVVQQKLTQANADLEQATAEAPQDFPAQLQVLLGRLRHHTTEIQPVFVQNMRREAPELFKQVQAGRRAMIRRHFGYLLKTGRRSGAIRRDIPVDMLIEILIGAVDAVAIPEKLEELDISPKAALLQVISVFLTGIMTDSARSKL